MPPDVTGTPRAVSCLPHTFLGAPGTSQPVLEIHIHGAAPGGGEHPARPKSVQGVDSLPDFTLPLVDMAEMDKPVMVVTVTDIRMMSHVRAAGRGHHFVPASPQPPSLLCLP